MSLASSNLVQLRLIKEVTFGTIPGTGNPNNFRMTGESLAFALQKESSKEIRSDRQVTDVILVGASASGGANFELSYKEYDTMIEACLQGPWSVYVTLGVGTPLSLTIDSTAGTLLAGVAPTGNDAFSTLAVGQWFRLTAPSDLANGAFLKIAAKTSTLITVDTSTPIPGTGSRAVGASSIATSRLTNGVTQRSFSIEKGFTDVTQYFAYRGMVPSKMSMDFKSGSIVTGSFDFVGRDSVRSNTTQMPGTPVASQTYDVMNAVAGVGNVLENGAALSGTFIKSLKFSQDNKLRGQTAIGVLGNAGIGSGTFEVTGEIEVYLADGTLYDKFLNNTASSLTFTAKDTTSGYGYAFTFPKVKYSDAKVQAGGLDQDVLLAMPFTALMDTTTSKVLLIDRLGPA